MRSMHMKSLQLRRSVRHGSLRTAPLYLVLSLIIPCAANWPSHAQEFKQISFAGMQWRLVGPMRGGRVTAVSGVPSQPAVYYMGTPAGGVWKTTNAGTTWNPIFDQ